MFLSFFWLARSGDVVAAPLLLLSLVRCRALAQAVADAIPALAVADVVLALAASWHLNHFRFEFPDLSAVALIFA